MFILKKSQTKKMQRNVKNGCLSRSG